MTPAAPPAPIARGALGLRSARSAALPAAVLLGILLSAVSNALAVAHWWRRAGEPPVDETEGGDGAFAFWLILALVVWMIPTVGTAVTARFAARGYLSARVVLTILMGLFLAYHCRAVYGGLNTAIDLASGVTSREWLEGTRFFPYLGAVGILLDLTLALLAALVIVLTWVGGRSVTPTTGARFLRPHHS